VILSFVTQQSENRALSKCKSISVCDFHIACPIWCKFLISDLLILLFSIYKIPDAGESVLSLWAHIQLHLDVYCDTLWHFESKQRFGNFRLLHHRVHPSKFCLVHWG
jgi:hypothetical protein